MAKKKTETTGQAKALLYVGPDIKALGLVRNTAFRAGELPGHLGEIKDRPEIKLLLVFPADVPAARAEIKRAGSRRAQACKAVAELAAGMR